MLQERVVEANEHFSSKQRAAVQREVVRLLDNLAPERSPQRREPVDAAVSAHRWPARCILQGAHTAVSVSWFPARPAEDALGEILVIAWNGTVSVPGITHSNRAPEATRTVTLLPVEQDGGDFKWREAVGDDLIPTADVALYCRSLLDEQ